MRTNTKVRWTWTRLLGEFSLAPSLAGTHICVRFCTWKSLKVMDTLVNTLLGRPTSFAQSTSPPTSNHQDASTILDASFELSTMIEEFTSQGRTDLSASLPASEEMLQRIRRRMNTFPNSYRSIKVTDLATLQPDGLAGMIGNVHLACIYYFAVMLIARPYFMASMVTRMKAAGTGTMRTKQVTEFNQMAEACIDAAVFMATMAKGALNAGILLANMVILKYASKLGALFVPTNSY